ncbi:MAG TPA: prepilin-type N-terminal cleavage/methylation domain-containing protein [Candidatus Binatia bacterium]
MKIQNPKSKIQNGFTLLEVVVGMAIVSLGVVTLLEVFSSGLRLGAKGAERTEAADAGRQVMDEVLTRREIAQGREDGTAANGERWSVKITPLRGDSGLDLSAGWELREISLQMGSALRMKTLRLVPREGTAR